MFKIIMFDFGKVLAYPVTGSWYITPKTAEIIGEQDFMSIMANQNAVDMAFEKALLYLKDNHLLHTQEEEKAQFTQFYKLFFNYMGVKTQTGLCEDLAEDVVYNDGKVAVYDDVWDGLQELQLKYRIAILSDTWPSLRRILCNTGISSLLDDLFMSCDFNETKENVKLFEIALSRLNEDPNNILFVDDSTTNLFNAEKVGLVPVLMDRSNQHQKSPYPIVRNMNDIKTILFNDSN